jgi:hypothetical protein
MPTWPVAKFLGFSAAYYAVQSFGLCCALLRISKVTIMWFGVTIMSFWQRLRLYWSAACSDGSVQKFFGSNRDHKRYPGPHWSRRLAKPLVRIRQIEFEGQIIPHFDRSYAGVMHRAVFSGGVHSGASWLRRGDILIALNLLGFSSIEIELESPDGDRPSFSLIAKRWTTAFDRAADGAPIRALRISDGLNTLLTLQTRGGYLFAFDDAI